MFFAEVGEVGCKRFAGEDACLAAKKTERMGVMTLVDCLGAVKRMWWLATLWCWPDDAPIAEGEDSEDTQTVKSSAP